MIKPNIQPMVRPFLMATAVLTGGLTLAPSQALAEASRFSSRISEVDACNQAQYLMPDAAVAQRFRLTTAVDKQGPRFDCTVSWSTNAKATPTYAPILFPNPVAIPVIWSGWF